LPADRRLALLVGDDLRLSLLAYRLGVALVPGAALLAISASPTATAMSAQRAAREAGRDGLPARTKVSIPAGSGPVDRRPGKFGQSKRLC